MNYLHIIEFILKNTNKIRLKFTVIIQTLSIIVKYIYVNK